jgi:hypothetical protein
MTNIVDHALCFSTTDDGRYKVIDES